MSAEFVSRAGRVIGPGPEIGRAAKLPDNSGFADRRACRPHYSAPSSENESRLNDWLSPSRTVGPPSAPIREKIGMRLKLSFAHMT